MKFNALDSYRPRATVGNLYPRQNAAFGRLIRRLMHRQEIETLKDLAKMVGASNGYLCEVMSGKENVPSRDFVRRIAHALNTDETILLKAALDDTLARHFLKMAAKYFPTDHEIRQRFYVWERQLLKVWRR